MTTRTYASLREDTRGEPQGGSQGTKQLPLWQETLLLLGLALVPRDPHQGLLRPGLLHPVALDGAAVRQERPDPGAEGVLLGRRRPQRGDIVVFKDPGGWLRAQDTQGPKSGVKKVMETIGLYPAGGHLVKRVIGVGGDRVVCCDARVASPSTARRWTRSPTCPRAPLPSLTRFDGTVPKGHLWMMGDNRSDSSDSREHMGQPGRWLRRRRPRRRQGVRPGLAVERAELIHRPARSTPSPTAQ